MLNRQSLKTVIAINLALILLTIVILIDFIFVSTGQKDYIDKKKKDNQVLALSIRNMFYTDKEQTFPASPSARQYINEIAQLNDIAAIVVIGPDGTPLFYDNGEKNEKMREILVRGASEALLSGKSKTDYYGKTWGAFFIKNQYLIVSIPLRISPGAIPAAVSSAVDLAPFYASQRKNQLFIIFYTIINILVLTILGTYVISRATIRPINSLVKRAEECQDHDSLDLFFPQGKNEFRRLSTSLNRMLDRIDQDKYRLKNSLISLEKANREIKNRQNELIRAEKLASVGRLSAGIAHEIGNPIGIVLGYLEMLNRQDITENDKKDYIKRCLNEIQKISKIIRELLDFSRPSGKEATETVAVHALVQETMDLLAVQPVMRNITKEYKFLAASDSVSAVPDKLRQVFVNLILNAADAISATVSGSGTITVRSSTLNGGGRDERLGIEISDNGVGINQADLETIFDPFYTTKDPGHGTGLGLYVCYMILDSMGGTIDVVSTPGAGSTFTIQLPLADNEMKKRNGSNEQRG